MPDYSPVFPDIPPQQEQDLPAWLTGKEQPVRTEPPVWQQKLFSEKDKDLIHETPEQRQVALNAAKRQGHADGVVEGQNRLREQLHEEIHQSIYEASYQEGCETGQKDGYTAGLEQAKPHIEQQLALLRDITSQLDTWQCARDQKQLTVLQNMLCALTKEVVMAEVKLQPETIQRAIHAAMNALPESDGHLVITLHPDDKNSAEVFRQQLEANWAFAEDDTITPGGCHIATHQSDVDSTLNRRLAGAIGLVQGVLGDSQGAGE